MGQRWIESFCESLETFNDGLGHGWVAERMLPAGPPDDQESGDWVGVLSGDLEALLDQATSGEGHAASGEVTGYWLQRQRGSPPAIKGELRAAITITIVGSVLSLRAAFQRRPQGDDLGAFTCRVNFLELCQCSTAVTDGPAPWRYLWLLPVVSGSGVRDKCFPCILISRPQARRLLAEVEAGASLRHELFGLFGHRQLSDLPGVPEAPFGQLGHGLEEAIRRFAAEEDASD